MRAYVATKKGAPAGIYAVWVQFVVDKEGNVSDIKSLTNWGYGIEQEVMRLIKNSPKWSPAIQTGRTVKAFRKQPVTFVIEEDGLEVYPSKGNALYIGIDNSVTVKAINTKDENLRVTISQGSITGSNGSYIAQVITEEGPRLKFLISIKKLALPV